VEKNLMSKRPALVESFEPRVLFSTFVVSNTADSGSGSLRDAMTRANSSSDADVIQFKIGSGLHTIAPKSALPQLKYPTTLDGTTQGSYAGKPLIEIRGDSAGSGSNGIVLVGGSSTVKGLIVNRFGANGILVITKGGNAIKNCWVGTDSSGSYAAGNKQKGIILQSSSNTVGGTSTADRVVISGNVQAGIQFYTSAASGNKLLASYVGTDYSGSKAIPNGGSGVAVNSGASNMIGWSGAPRNVISGNSQDGVVINGSGAKYNTVENNYIGLNASGNAKIGNANYGVEISQPSNTVGGTTSADRNVISGNKYTGVVLWTSSANACKVIGNYIGTDATGMLDLGNVWRGVDISSGSYNNIIGGATSSERNVIAGNDQDGVRIYQGSANHVESNYLGIAADGSKALPNTGDGVRLTQTSTALIDYNKIGYNGGYAIFNGTSSGTIAHANTLVNDALFSIKQT
jgi:hypothetical protein